MVCHSETQDQQSLDFHLTEVTHTQEHKKVTNVFPKHSISISYIQPSERLMNKSIQIQLNKYDLLRKTWTLAMPLEAYSGKSKKSD